MSKNPIMIRNLRDASNGKKGLWINNRMLKSSLEVGDKVKKIYSKDGKSLTLKKVDPREEEFDLTISFRKSNPDMPILDLKSSDFDIFCKDIEKVKVEFMDKELCISRAEIEQNYLDRKLKTSLKTYELFCGGGTLSYAFKMAGFEPAGGIELEDNPMDFFIKNNTVRSTIIADINDIMPNYYPKDIHVLLIGFPCHKFTNANKHMNDAKTREKNGLADQKDLDMLQERLEVEYWAYYVIEAIRTMNPRTVVFEEVTEFMDTFAYSMIKHFLKLMKYDISETISEGTNTKRKRWCMVANSNGVIDLDYIMPLDHNIPCLAEVLGKPIDAFDWQPIENIQRIFAASQKSSIGIRSCTPLEQKSNTFTTHGTRHTEPCFKHPEEDLYYEFTNEDIVKIHGLHGYNIEDEKKTHARKVLGNGVTNLFYYVALKIMESFNFEEGRLF